MTELTYEMAYAELRDLLAELQEGAVSIDDLTTKVARAQELVTFCREKLRQTEMAVQALTLPKNNV